MTDKEKQIEEMAKAIIDRNKLNEFSPCKTCVDEKCSFLCYRYCKIYDECSILCAAGYRKQSEVAENIIEMLKMAKPVVKVHFEAYDELIENIAAEYGVEVEK